MDEYRVSGSTAYAPLPVKRPSRLPEEPKKKAQIAKKSKAGVAPFTVVGTAVALVMLFCVLFSYARLFETQSERAEMQSKRDELLLQQEHLRAQYESSIDLQAIEKRAEELGMHLPRADQIKEVQIVLPETEETAPAQESMGVFGAFQALWRDLQEYFS